MPLEFVDTSRVEIDSNINLGPSYHTFCCWAKLTDYDTSNDQFLFGKITSGGADIFSIFSDNDSGTLGIRLKTGTSSSDFTGFSNFFTADNVWVHVAMTYDSSESTNNIKVYKNGAFFDEDTHGGDQDDITQDATGGVWIGNDVDNPDDNYLYGELEDVRLYNVVLNEDQINTIYLGEGRDYIIDGLYQWWPLNEKSSGTASGASSVINLISDGETGTPINSPTYTETILRI